MQGGLVDVVMSVGRALSGGRVVENRTAHGHEEYRVCPYDGMSGCVDAYEYRYRDGRLPGKEFCCVDESLWACRLRRAVWVCANVVKV